MLLSDKQTHLDSVEHKYNHIKTWCEDCNKYISDKTRHFQSEIHLQKSQQSNKVKK